MMSASLAREDNAIYFLTDARPRFGDSRRVTL